MANTKPPFSYIFIPPFYDIFRPPLTFNVYLGENPLGGIKLYCEKLDSSNFSADDWPRSTYLVVNKRKPAKLDGTFCSVGYSKRFYTDLLNFCNDNMSKVNGILENLRDISMLTLTDILKFENCNGFEKSLLRFNSTKFIISIVKLLRIMSIKDNVLFWGIIKNRKESIKQIYDLCKKNGNNKSFIRILEMDYDYAALLVESLENESLDDTDKKFLNELKEKFNDKTELILKIDKILNNKITELILNIRNELIVNNWSKYGNIKLGHYAPLNSISKLIRPNSFGKEDNGPFLRLTNSRQMNDPMEGRALINFLGILDKSKEYYQNSEVYVSSATTALDSLPMWKQYAEDATGVMLIYSDSFLKKILSPSNEFKIARVCYLKKDENEEIEIKVSGLNDGEYKIVCVNA